MGDNQTLSRLVNRLLDEAQHEFAEYLQAVVAAWLDRNDADPEEVELVVDTYDPTRIVLYPRVKARRLDPVGPPRFPYVAYPQPKQLIEEW